MSVFTRSIFSSSNIRTMADIHRGVKKQQCIFYIERRCNLVRRPSHQFDCSNKLVKFFFGDCVRIDLLYILNPFANFLNISYADVLSFRHCVIHSVL